MNEHRLAGRRVISKRTGESYTVVRVFEQYGNEALEVRTDAGVCHTLWPYQVTLAGGGDVGALMAKRS